MSDDLEPQVAPVLEPPSPTEARAGEYVPPTRRPVALARDRAAINLEWLINLRWAAVAGQLITVLVVRHGFGVDLPIGALFLVLATEVVTNGALIARLRRHQVAVTAAHESGAPPPAIRVELLQTGVMVFDTLLVLVLLALTGGASNPFCAFLLVHVVLAGALLRPKYSIVGAAFVAFSVAVLPFVSNDLAVLTEREAVREWGMVVAVGLTSLLAAFFTSRVRAAFDRRSQQLTLQRQRQESARHLEAIGTLAAGAAHELGTPLGTIAIVAKELERALEKPGVLEHVPGDVLEDARLVRSEVARCRRILDRMNFDAGEQAGEPLVVTDVRDLVQYVVDELQEPQRVEIRVEPDAASQRVLVPREGLTTALRALAQNALDASKSEQSIAFRAAVSGTKLELYIVDQGHGMDPEQAARAGEPFFTTKEPGRGMGLGLYLSRSVVERLSGTLELTSAPGQGTTAKVSLPLDVFHRARRDPLIG